MTMSNPPSTDVTGIPENKGNAREEFRRYAREELPQLRQELAEVRMNLQRIARGEPPLRRGARRASR